jgi:hypothetical protein
LESAKALGPLIDPNLRSCGSVPPHGHRELAHPEPGFYTVASRAMGARRLSSCSLAMNRSARSWPPLPATCPQRTTSTSSCRRPAFARRTSARPTPRRAAAVASAGRGQCLLPSGCSGQEIHRPGLRLRFSGQGIRAGSRTRVMEWPVSLQPVRIFAQGFGDAPDPERTFGARRQSALRCGSFANPQHIGGLQHGCLSLRANQRL